MRRYASAHGLLESSYDPVHSNVSSNQLKALLSGSSVGSRQPTVDQADSALNGHPLQTLAPMGTAPTAGLGPNLPISLQIGDYKVWDYLVEVMSRGWTDAGAFRLSPAYSLYLALRFFHAHSKPYLVQFFTRIAHHMNQISQDCTSRDELLFWLANASELSFLVERDADLRTPRAGQLGTVVKFVFQRLCTVLLGALRPACRPMLDVNIPIEDGSNELLSLLDGTLRAARASRLNAALTIQLCSQPVQLTTRLGKYLQARLAALHGWAEQMGVELAAECHLDRSRQAAALLAAQKNDVAALGATCYKLNSLQVRYLLSNFVAYDGEIPCDHDVIARIVGLAERQADNLTLQDGQPITLAESEQLLLPFLLPQDGYAAEQLRGVPDGLVQYLLLLQDKGLCHSLSVQESSLATWRASPSTSNSAAVPRPPVQAAAPGPSPQLPVKSAIARTSSQSTLTSLPTTQFGDSFGSMNEEIIRVVLKRGGGGIGLSIVAAQGVGDRQVGIYVKKVVAGSPAALDGRLAAGDQLLSVNGQSLLGISQEEAADFMARAGTEVRFDVRKGAAHRNGLAAWLCQPPMSASTPATSVQQSFPPPQQQPPQQQPSRNSVPNFNSNYSNYAQLPGYGSQQSVQTAASNYQKYQPVPTQRTSAFAPVASVAPLVEPNRHYRSVSASDLYQSDPNASYSQRSVAGSTTGVSGFDRLPAHYRHSNRPTVIQPGRPSASSPSALRRGAQSPVSMYRPPSANNLFAAPRSPNPLQQQGYVSAAARDSNLDLHRMSLPSSPPAAHSSPREEHRIPSSTSSSMPHTMVGYSSSLPSPINQTNYSNTNYQQLPGNRNFPTVRCSPKGPSPSSYVPNGNASGAYGRPALVRPQQEAAVVRPIELPMPREEVNLRHRDEHNPRSTTTFGVMAPTAFTQALQAGGAHEARVVLAPPRHSGFERELRNLERTNTALMSREAVNEELDRLDAKGINMTEDETRRYSENISPGDAYERKTVQFKEMVKETEIMDSPSIYGTNEIYRDPRQQRLNELQERQQTQSHVPDGLGFRDKMRMFATQLGEATPKSRYNASSAERQIQSEQ
ncbi:unnamed protein product [Nippostrongylus brasiliensis]|uniref:Afadin (inferred by orthology to a human protein) n=1 Tax=Nippostrongylus brasiliensis TaxID=27835 RepID=A0A158QYF6_NIPBR|nr:unnamed protein product [Nippostrongylus brasiliensis]